MKAWARIGGRLPGGTAAPDDRFEKADRILGRIGVACFLLAAGLLVGLVLILLSG